MSFFYTPSSTTLLYSPESLTLILLSLITYLDELAFEFSIDPEKTVATIGSEHPNKIILVFLFDVQVGLLLLQFRKVFLYRFQVVFELRMQRPEFLSFLRSQIQLLRHISNIQCLYILYLLIFTTILRIPKGNST